jgi:Flp pilus assembly pilin Flp
MISVSMVVGRARVVGGVKQRWKKTQAGVL